MGVWLCVLCHWAEISTATPVAEELRPRGLLADSSKFRVPDLANISRIRFWKLAAASEDSICSF